MQADRLGAARQLARALVEHNIALVYGGGKVGLMGVIADEVLRLGGEVTGVMDAPNRKILEIDYRGKEVLVPFVIDFVPDLDLDAGTLVITPPEGLLDV